MSTGRRDTLEKELTACYSTDTQTLSALGIITLNLWRYTIYIDQYYILIMTYTHALHFSILSSMYLGENGDNVFI